ncbi:MAG: histidinol-phosphate aminotransferase family protein [Oscillospiraceae bacterium]|jgi:histidinol-phosphate aminotransferase|nr:histidinol-phosphate aminotransferase family protein [Oscillospiraceae bacterium]
MKKYALPERVKKLIPYEPITGDYEIRLDANESPYNLPEYLKEKIIAEISEIDFNRYSDPYATKAVKAFADYYNIKPENVVAGNGSDELIGYIVSVLTEGKICVLSDDFSMYRIYAELYNKEFVIFQKERKTQVNNKTLEDFIIDPEKLIAFCQEQDVKMLMFSNPCNPTSMGLNKTDVRNIINALPETLIILDEAYMDFWNQSLIEELFPNVVILRTASKAFGLAGIRMGFAVANIEIITALKAIKAPYNTNAISQKIVEIIYSDKEYLKNFEYFSLKNKLVGDIAELGFKVLNSTTNFVYFETEKAEDIYKFLLENSIAVRCFGNTLRITSGTESENNVLIGTLKRFNNANSSNNTKN